MPIWDWGRFRLPSEHLTRLPGSACWARQPERRQSSDFFGDDFQANLVAPLTNSFTLTVTGGSGSGFYTNGQQVAIAAYNTPYQTFVRWTGDTQYVANVNASNTTVTMPAQNIALDVIFSYFTPVSWPDMYVPRYNEQGTNYAPYPLVANGTLTRP